jgi:hypothetical protein
MNIKNASRRELAVAVALAISTACGVEHQSTQLSPTPSQVDVSGRWATDVTVQGVSARMTWMLTQATGGITGPVLVSLPNGIVLLNGSLTGTLAGTSMPYTIRVGTEGVPSQPACSGQFGGTMNVTTTQMSGSMALISSNCAVQFPANGVTLTKQ